MNQGIAEAVQAAVCPLHAFTGATTQTADQLHMHTMLWRAHWERVQAAVCPLHAFTGATTQTADQLHMHTMPWRAH
eukprot:1156725-Pelagomonas_calceolata.AAC.6